MGKHMRRDLRPNAAYLAGKEHISARTRLGPTESRPANGVECAIQWGWRVIVVVATALSVQQHYAPAAVLTGPGDGRMTPLSTQLPREHPGVACLPGRDRSYQRAFF